MKKYQKMRPFKCRICTQRFETREQAQVHAKSHQPDYFKCGMCSATFNRRDLLMKHLETHDKNKQPQIQMVSSVHQVPTTQKMLQETIDEALRDPNDVINQRNIQFHSCDLCSVTFLNEALYLQHMKQHKVSQQTTGKTNNGSFSQEEQTKIGEQESTAGGGQGMPDELESIFERIHSEKSDVSTSQVPNADNLVITTAENATGGITFNITIPPQQTETSVVTSQADDGQQVSIDMPTLDVNDDAKEGVKQETGEQGDQAQAPVSMPSLDDDGQETQQSHQSNTEAVPMELDEIQTSGDGQQVKFIVNENGQLLSLENHILTTDADGNQILVQGTDIEQLQALLQSGSIVMQNEDGISEGQTLQMLATGDGQNQQMVIIQGPDGQEAHMIDASLIDADGNIVIQQPGGEFTTDGTHITTEDGSVIPVSFATSADGEHITVTEGSEQHLQLLQQHAEGQTLLLQDGQIIQQTEDGQLIQHEGQLITTEEHQEGVESTVETQDQSEVMGEQQQAEIEDQSSQPQHQQTTETNSGGDGFLNFDELIQPQIIQKVSS